jgi:3-methylcrotonyl-CoA carboxylase beta subunit
MNLEQNRNEDWMKIAVSQSRQHFEKIKMGGGKKAIDKQKERNKLTARERIDYLCDKGMPLQRSALLQVLRCMRSKAVAPAAELLPGLVM